MTLKKMPFSLHISTLSFSILCLSLLLSGVSSASEGETQAQRKQRLKDYYIVDLIIFKHNENSVEASEHPELWAKNIDFVWPEDTVQLMAINPLSIYPELRSDVDTLSNGVRNKFSDEAAIGNAFRKKRLPITTNALSELSDDAKKIDRVARYKLLSKRSWMQKITTKETPRDIIIPIDINLANDSNGISFLIDPNKTYVTGTINFKKGRYLHLSTDLLIIKLLEEAVKEVDGTDETTDAVQTVSLSAPEDVNELSAENEADPFITTPKPQWPDLILKSRALEQSYYSKTNKKASEQTPYPLVIDSSHIAQIAPMKQRRKMRSSETHYIDHPLVGLVVRITPLVKLLD